MGWGWEASEQVPATGQATGGRDVPRGGSDDAGAFTCCVSASRRAKPREAPPVQFNTSELS